ncbi:hypothetical protein [Desulfosporosinus sp. OT]|uniref:hypothetical protein n=1 Tax=Desulfosporosinus sp. OT TaxID=913865 RepID=UPI001300C9ED|nr:hypothetical protein [Desulfosporosinus sp. OT]
MRHSTSSIGSKCSAEQATWSLPWPLPPKMMAVRPSAPPIMPMQMLPDDWGSLGLMRFCRGWSERTQSVTVNAHQADRARAYSLSQYSASGTPDFGCQNAHRTFRAIEKRC